MCPALLENILRESVELGAHTNMMVYTRQGAIHTYSWGHPIAKPYGVALPLNCKACGRLGSWSVPSMGLSTLPTIGKFPCKGPGCSYVFSCSIPTLHRVGSKSQDASGEWFIGCLKAPDAAASSVGLKWSYVDGILTGASINLKHG